MSSFFIREAERIPDPDLYLFRLAFVQQYQHKHNKEISCPAMAQLLSNTLYYKRFFPYYTFNLLGGLDNEGMSHAGLGAPGELSIRCASLLGCQLEVPVYLWASSLCRNAPGCYSRLRLVWTQRKTFSE